MKINYTINGKEVCKSKDEIIDDLLHDKYGYNHTCKCGTEQTYNSLYNFLKYDHVISDTQFKCKICKCSRPCTVFGIEYPSVRDACEESYDENVCKCEICGSIISKDNWYQWCQRYLEGTMDENGKYHIKCHSCISSETRTKLNEIYHDDLSKQVSERNYQNWKDNEYREYMTKILTDNINNLWTNTDRIYGKNANLTFAEMRSEYARENTVFGSNFMYAMWEEYRNEKGFGPDGSLTLSEWHSQYFGEVISDLWNSNDKCYGPDGNLTFRDFISNQSSEIMTNLWNSNDKCYGPDGNLTFRDFISYNVLRDVNTGLKDCVSGNVNNIKLLYDKYKNIYQLDYQNTNDELLTLKSQMNSKGIQCNMYIAYLSNFNINNYGNHHILMTSIFKDEDCPKVSLNNIEHTLAHLLLFLDNFHNEDFCEDISDNNLKILLALNVRYRFGYKKFINKGIEFNTANANMFWVNEELLKDIELILE